MLVKIDDITPEQVASICDHTFLNRSEAYKEESKKLGQSAVMLRRNAFIAFLNETLEGKLTPFAVCVRPEDVSFTGYEISTHKKSNIKIASVVGFPDGSWYDTSMKLNELRLASENFADEVDFVLNYIQFKDRKLKYEAASEIASLSHEAKELVLLSKMILETSELNADEIKYACQLADEQGIDFVKTSTGFSAYGAREEDLRIMRQNFSRGVKISGGVTVDNYKSLLKAASGRDDGYIDLDPMKIRIGESGLLTKLAA